MDFQDGGFNAHDYKPLDDFTPLPAGQYKVIIIADELKTTKAGNGSYLQLTMQVVEGEHEGRRLFDRLNLDNPNQETVDIANRTLASIGRAVGRMVIRNSQELHDIPMMVKVVVKPAKGDFGASNEIKGYISLTGKSAPKSPATAAPGKQVAPWKRPASAPAPEPKKWGERPASVPDGISDDDVPF